MRDVNFFAIDIDEAKNEDDYSEVVAAVMKHSIIAFLFPKGSGQGIHFVPYYYQRDNGIWSIHLTFNIRLPLHLCTKIAIDVSELTGIVLDKAIYKINGSLRIPGCINIK